MTIVKGAGDRERRRDYVGTAAMCVCVDSVGEKRENAQLDR